MNSCDFLGKDCQSRDWRILAENLVKFSLNTGHFSLCSFHAQGSGNEHLRGSFSEILSWCFGGFCGSLRYWNLLDCEEPSHGLDGLFLFLNQGHFPTSMGRGVSQIAS